MYAHINPESLVLGLTGGIACGKSAALKAFSSLGWNTVSTDELCHRAYREHASKLNSAIQMRWGNSSWLTATGEIDREAIATRVFAHPAELKWLNEQLHPLIFAMMRSEVESASSRPTIVEVPLLFECGWNTLFTQTVSLWSNLPTILNRLASRGWTKAQLQQRLTQQMPVDAKLALADFGIINNGTYEHLFAQCATISETLRPLHPPLKV